MSSAEVDRLRAERDKLAAECGALAAKLAAVNGIAEGWQATIDSGLMAGSEWESCLRMNLPDLRKALHDQE